MTPTLIHGFRKTLTLTDLIPLPKEWSVNSLCEEYARTVGTGVGGGVADAVSGGANAANGGADEDSSSASPKSSETSKSGGRNDFNLEVAKILSVKSFSDESQGSSFSTSLDRRDSGNSKNGNINGNKKDSSLLKRQSILWTFFQLRWVAMMGLIILRLGYVLLFVLQPILLGKLITHLEKRPQPSPTDKQGKSKKQ